MGTTSLAEQNTQSSKRQIPKVNKTEANNVDVKIERNGQLRELYGVKAGETAKGLLLAAINMLGESGEQYRDFISSMAVEMEPKDAIEAMLVSQIAGTHAAISMFSARAVDSNTQQMREGYERSVTRLSRTFLAQVDALKKYRGVAPQSVKVDSVTVNEGGQAIVGAVTSRS